MGPWGSRFRPQPPQFTARCSVVPDRACSSLVPCFPTPSSAQIAVRYYRPALAGKSLTKKVHGEVQAIFVERFGPFAGWWVEGHDSYAYDTCTTDPAIVWCATSRFGPNPYASWWMQRVARGYAAAVVGL